MLLSKADREQCEKLGIPISTVYYRLKKGWDKEEAISTPPNPKKSHDLKRSDSGEVLSRGLGKYTFGFRLPVELEQILLERLEATGKSPQEYLEQLLTEHLS